MDNSDDGMGCVGFLVIMGILIAWVFGTLSLSGCSAPTRQEVEVRSQVAVATVESKAENLVDGAVTKGQSWYDTMKSAASGLKDKTFQTGRKVVDQVIYTGESVIGTVKQRGKFAFDTAIFHAHELEIKADLTANKVWRSANGVSIQWIEGDECFGWAVYYFGEYDQCIGATSEALDSFLK